MDIASLEGYDTLRQSIVDAIRKAESDEPKWVFENEEILNLSEMHNDSRSRHSRMNELSGKELLEKIISGRVFDAEDYLFDRSIDPNQDLDIDWHQKSLEEAIEKTMSNEILSFAENHDIDEDDLIEFLKNDDELSFSEVFDYGLHHVKYNYQGSVPAKINLNCTISLEACAETVVALHTLKIPPEAWISAVVKWSSEHEIADDDSSPFMSNGSEFNEDIYRDLIYSESAKISNRVISHASDNRNSLVDAYSLIEHMIEDWCINETDLLLRFNIGSDHIDTISRPVNRILESHEIDLMPIQISEAEILPSHDSAYGKGLPIKNPYKCLLEEISLCDYDSESRDEASISLDGSMGMLINTYELLLSEDASDPNLISNSENYSIESFSPALIGGLSSAFKNADAFDSEKILAKYPKFSSLLPEDIVKTKKSAQTLGIELFNLLSENTFEDQKNWERSERRERASWLVRQGADLSIRSADNGFQSKGPMAIHMAAGMGDIDLLMTMAENGAKLQETYSSSNEENSIEKGLWEVIAEKILYYKNRNSEIDSLNLTNALKFLESSGCAPLPDSLIFTQGGQQTNLNSAIIMINDEAITESHIERLTKDQISFALYVGMTDNSFDFAKRCIDAGARTNDPLVIGHKTTVEQAARSKEQKSWVKNTAIEDAIGYSQCLEARDVVDALMASNKTYQRANISL